MGIDNAPMERMSLTPNQANNDYDIEFNLNRTGNFLRERRIELGLELKDIADATGSDLLTVSKWEIGREFELTKEQLKALSDILEVDQVVITGLPIYFPDEAVRELNKPQPDHIIAMPARRVPVLGSIAAGMPLYMDEDILDYIFTDRHDGGVYIALLVKGDSMNLAGINDGSTVLIQETPCVENGTIAAISIDGEEATIKEYHKNGNTVTLYPQSSNPDNQPQIYNTTETDVRIMGVVVETRTKLIENISRR